MRQRVGGRRQQLPLVRHLRIHPRFETHADPLAGGEQQQHDRGHPEERLHQRVRDDRAHLALGTARHQPAQGQHRRGAQGGRRDAPTRQPPIERLDHLAAVRHARGQHRAPEQDDSREAAQLDHRHPWRPPVVRQPVPGHEDLVEVVGRRRPHAQQEPGTEQHDPAHLGGQGPVRPQRDHDHRGHRRQVQDGDRDVHAHEERPLRVSHPGHGERCRTRHRETAPDPHADPDHAARQVLEAGLAIHPRTLPGERPQERRGEHHRLHVQETKDDHRGRQLPDGVVQLRGRRQLPQHGQEHVRGRRRRPQQEIGPEQPRPPVVAPREKQQARVRDVPDQLGPEIGGEVAVRPAVVHPPQREQHQRHRHLDPGDRHESSRGTRDTRTGLRLGRSRGGRRRSPSAAGREQRSQCAQVVEQAAPGGRREPRATVPVHVLVPGDRIGRVADEAILIGATHRT